MNVKVISKLGGDNRTALCSNCSSYLEYDMFDANIRDQMEDDERIASYYIQCPECQKLVTVKKPRYPSEPRLSPDGKEVICDQCQRRWKPGQDPGCAECAAAFEAMEKNT
jgi:RNase P subunit RPR2